MFRGSPLVERVAVLGSQLSAVVMCVVVRGSLVAFGIVFGCALWKVACLDVDAVDDFGLFEGSVVVG
jgi:hypothetical protein